MIEGCPKNAFLSVVLLHELLKPLMCYVQLFV